LRTLYKNVPGYSPEEEYGHIVSTVEAERRWAQEMKEVPWRATFTGVNGV
jgi:hypothetical protein